MAHSQELNDQLLANMFTAYEMPNSGCSDRTEATRRIGGLAMVEHLVSGDWQDVPYDMAVEIVARIAANAQRQGMRADEIITEYIANQHQAQTLESIDSSA